MVQVTIETTGTMLVGTDIGAAATIVRRARRADHRPELRHRPAGDGRARGAISARCWPGPISVLPNAGLPALVDGQTHYPLEPGELAAWLERFVVEDGVGDRRRLLRHHGRAHPRARSHAAPPGRGWRAAAAEGAHGRATQAESPRSTPRCRCARRTPISRSASAATPTAPRRSASARRPRTGTPAWRSGATQVKEGSHALDVCTAYVGRDETADMHEVVEPPARRGRRPLVFDFDRARRARSGARAVRRQGGDQLDQLRGRRGAAGSAPGARQEVRRRGDRADHRRARHGQDRRAQARDRAPAGRVRRGARPAPPRSADRPADLHDLHRQRGRPPPRPRDPRRDRAASRPSFPRSRSSSGSRTSASASIRRRATC